MKKYIVTAYYSEVYQLDIDPTAADDWWIEWGILYVESGTTDGLLEFKPVIDLDTQVPEKVEKRYDDAIFDDDDDE